MNFKNEIIKLLKSKLDINEEMLSVPPKQDMGDYALPCFKFAKEQNISPAEFSKNLENELSIIITNNEFIDSAKAFGPYINFFINKTIFIKKVIQEIEEKNNDYGNSFFGNNKNVVIEYPAPNTNKPLHLGHLRNICMGHAVSNIIESQGYNIFRVNLNNDRGIHICKSMLAYKNWGENKTPESENIKSDHFVGQYYVLYNEKLKENPSIEEEAKQMLKDWEAGDPGVIELWKKMNSWALNGFEETYKTLDIPEFNKVYYESETFEDGKKMVLDGVTKGIFKQKEDKSIIIDLTNDGFDEKILLRSDGTSVYITQDLYLAKKKHEDFSYDKSIYVVASEQKYHFSVLFKALEKLGHKFSEGCYHFSYGMVNLPSGRMKSREGTVVDTDDLILELKNISKQEIQKRHENINNEDLEHRSKIIALGAVRFYLVCNDAIKDIVFNPKDSLSFEGDTGPYIQYSYARCSSIINKAQEKNLLANHNFELLTHEKEIELTKLLFLFPEKTLNACENYKPHLVAQYLLSLCRTFNEFYHSCSCVNEDVQLLAGARLSLISATKQVIKNGLKLLGIETLEKM